MSKELKFKPCVNGLVAQLPNGGQIVNYDQKHFQYALGDWKYVYYPHKDSRAVMHAETFKELRQQLSDAYGLTIVKEERFVVKQGRWVDHYWFMKMPLVTM